MNITAILWHEWTLFKKKIVNITISNLVAPILYLVAFGWGLGDLTVEGMPYIDFIIPGVIAMTTMSSCFNYIAFNINISRFYDKTFEEYMSGPITVQSYAVGKTLATALYGFYIGMLILIMTSLFGQGSGFSIYFIFIMFLNCLIFSALGFLVGIVIKSHSDIGKFSNFIITPMSFLCGTFFSLEKMPIFLKKVIMVLPLSQTTAALRNQYLTPIETITPVMIMLFYLLVITFWGIKRCKTIEI